jgi:transposase-like protein
MSKWKAPNKVAETMDPQYRGWSTERRFKRAIELVLDDGISQSEAARRLGVTRARLNERVKAHRVLLAEMAERSRASRLAEIAADTPVDLEVGAEAPPETPVSVDVAQESSDRSVSVANEVRRVPPLSEFVEMYFRNVICTDCEVHHPLPDVHRDMMRHLEDPTCKRLLVNIAPFHAKSQVCTVYDTVQSLCADPNSRIAIVCKTERLAKRFVYQIQRFLTDDSFYEGGPNLIADWGPFHNPNQWNQNEFWVVGRQGVDKDPSVSAYGLGAQIYGYRFDKMKFDDVADLKNQKNPEMVADQFLWATQECASRVGKRGKMQFIGTRISLGDIYSHLEKLPGYRIVRYPCIVDEEGRQTVWNDHFGYEAAVRQRDSMSMVQFQLVYQNVEMAGLGASFPPEVLERCHDMDRKVGDFDGSWALVAGLDPAGAGEQAGYTALILEGVDLVTGKRYLVDIVNVKSMKAPQLRDQIFDWADRYPLRELRVESNGLQSQLVQYNTEIQARMTQRGVRVVPHITTGHNKWDQEFGVESMGPMYYNTQISVPWGDINSRAKFSPLMEQLAQFEMGGTNDLVMAHWFAELGCREVFQRTNVPAFDPRFKIPKRLRNRRHIVDFAAGTVRAPTADELRPTGRPMHGAGSEIQRRQLVNVPREVEIEQPVGV